MGKASKAKSRTIEQGVDAVQPKNERPRKPKNRTNDAHCANLKE
ncbi:hypothetical protein [Texcoconibacillus texcoconensis]|uniref:Uncharacterized protein n=1 Tax=Texcoconibacillus texcoconensis TaxID=1095777 RepID=A0A840QSI7_9BACI|nr:hypothetical protein [Texcoconibacillus texcoconensis]MBB5174324.1 hypothetical protein [Texcoconibacillus texcoconensis]